MSSENNLDDFLNNQSKKIHSSDRALAKLVRNAYPIGVPALIMKSSTADVIRSCASDNGVKSLLSYGLDLVKDGLTNSLFIFLF